MGSRGHHWVAALLVQRQLRVGEWGTCLWVVAGREPSNIPQRKHPVAPMTIPEVASVPAPAHVSNQFPDAHTSPPPAPIEKSPVMAAQHTLLVNTRVIRTMPLSARLAARLPKGTPGWSAVDNTLSQGGSAPVSLSSLRRKVNAAVIDYAQHRRQVDGLPVDTILKIFRPDRYAWDDTAGFVKAYRALVDAPGSPVVYSRAVNPSPFNSPFPLEKWWALHVRTCSGCDAHHHRHQSFLVAMQHNQSNPCVFADILSWLSGEWRIPFSEIPPRGAVENYESLSYDPTAMQAEIDKMKDWQVVIPGQPHVINPCMGVVRDSDVFDACRILQAIGHPSPTEDKKKVQEINAHIHSVLQRAAPVPAHLGSLKPIKVRMCVDASVLLNKYIKKWRFPYATVHDAVALVQPNWWMAKIDLERFYWQLLLHPEDWPMLGIRLPKRLCDWQHKLKPKDLRRLQEEVDTWVSPRAHFGGSPFPAYANAIMSAVGAILRAHGIPNVHLTDDLFICGATKDECQRNLDRAIAILQQLGWRLQLEKVTPPAQEMVFLGIMVDTVWCRLSVPQDKLDNYLRSVRQLLSDVAAGHVHAQDLESMVGKLGWITEVMIAGKARLHELRKSLPPGWNHNRRHAAAVTLSTGAIRDLQWWAQYLQHSYHNPLWVPFWTKHPPLHCRTYSDASGDVGFGLVIEDQVFQGLWSTRPETAAHSSGVKELIPVLMALLHLPTSADGKVVVITTDNLANVISINKGACRSADSASTLAQIMDLAAARQIYIIADWCPREHLELLDEISKEPWSEGDVVMYR